MGWYDYGSRYYNPMLGIFMAVDPQAFRGYGWGTYAYGLDNPIKYIDPDGEWVHIVIGAAIGGIVNLTVKALNGQINSVWDGFAAFGIGAAAGAITAATGGAAFAMAGGAAAGAGGFLAGAAGGMVGSGFGMIVQSMGNTAYFGDPLLTAKDFAIGVALGGLVGGSVNGLTALANGRNFMTGVLSAPKVAPQSVLPVPKAPKAEINCEAVKPKLQVASETVPVKTVKEVTQAIKTENYSVYKGTNPTTGEIEYIGITKRPPEVRFSEHAKSIGTGKELLEYEVIESAITNRMDARILEQQLINQYGGPNGGQLLNKINSISPNQWSRYGITP